MWRGGVCGVGLIFQKGMRERERVCVSGGTRIPEHPSHARTHARTPGGQVRAGAVDGPHGALRQAEEALVAQGVRQGLELELDGGGFRDGRVLGCVVCLFVWGGGGGGYTYVSNHPSVYIHTYEQLNQTHT